MTDIEETIAEIKKITVSSTILDLSDASVLKALYERVTLLSGHIETLLSHIESQQEEIALEDDENDALRKHAKKLTEENKALKATIAKQEEAIGVLSGGLEFYTGEQAQSKYNKLPEFTSGTAVDVLEKATNILEK